MTDFTIRLAKPGDESSIHEAHMRSIREICIRDHGEEEVQGWGNRPLSNRWKDAIRDDYVWVVEVDGKIYGHAYLKISEEEMTKRAHIHGLYLTPEVLGKGLGYQLACLMLDAAKKNRVQFVTLESTLTAHDFYQRLGFKDTGGIRTANIGGYPVRYFPMSLELD